MNKPSQPIDLLVRRFGRHYQTAIGYYEQSDYEAARREFEECIELIESGQVFSDESIPVDQYAVMTDFRSMVYSGHGDTLNYGLGDLVGATESYRWALAFQPGEKMLTFQYVEALYEQSRFSEGLDVVEDRLRLAPFDLDALLMMALLYWECGEGARALKYSFDCICHCETWDHTLGLCIRDPAYYASARGLIEEILLRDGTELVGN
jgi:tetratricopeptide (TPR) repeat protein